MRRATTMSEYEKLRTLDYITKHMVVKLKMQNKDEQKNVSREISTAWSKAGYWFLTMVSNWCLYTHSLLSVRVNVSHFSSRMRLISIIGFYLHCRLLIVLLWLCENCEFSAQLVKWKLWLWFKFSIEMLTSLENEVTLQRTDTSK